MGVRRRGQMGVRRTGRPVGRLDDGRIESSFLSWTRTLLHECIVQDFFFWLVARIQLVSVYDFALMLRESMPCTYRLPCTQSTTIGYRYDARTHAYIAYCILFFYLLARLKLYTTRSRFRICFVFVFSNLHMSSSLGLRALSSDG